MFEFQLYFTKTNPKAIKPVKGSPQAAGWDLFSVTDITLKPKTVIPVDTGIAFAFPEGYYGRVTGRSGFALKQIVVGAGAGVIDPDYRGSVKVILNNQSDEAYEIKYGDRIAQIVCEKIGLAELVEKTELDTTIRGNRGFGSTGFGLTNKWDWVHSEKSVMDELKTSGLNAAGDDYIESIIAATSSTSLEEK